MLFLASCHDKHQFNTCLEQSSQVFFVRARVGLVGKAGLTGSVRGDRGPGETSFGGEDGEPRILMGFGSFFVREEAGGGLSEKGTLT
ncbi:MAG: hypothetical protein KKH74_01485 [Gammaproteobacteria bacterium]|nr:hypothetical protein [Gammaproteobacteria bacterium]MBU1732496.1 hypothetical protein [Gammaproteobacteria bacterium]MBU1892632.1 hypothetical protein [Gammaproteobacteria bacterium]